MNSSEVTARDIEVAKDMGAPDSAIESMESGEWRYVSDRRAVRYAELALDYMKEAYGQECKATWTALPWVMRDHAEVTLIASGGAHDGDEVIVTISLGEPREYTDTWASVVRSDEYTTTVMEALNNELANLPEGSWAATTRVNDDVDANGALAGAVDIYFDPRAIPSQQSLDDTCQSIERALRSSGTKTTYFVAVTTQVPPEGIMSIDFGLEAAKAGGDSVFGRASGYVDGDTT